MGRVFESIANLVNTLFKNASRYITLDMCERVAVKDPYTLEFVPDPLWTKNICKRPYTLEYVLGQYKTQTMCKKAIEEDP